MIVGVPRETKPDEYRVGILPVGVEELIRAGHRVLVEAGAGLGSGLADHEYLKHGAEMISCPEEIYGLAEMVIKVKEPQAAEIPFLRQGSDRLHLFSLRCRSSTHGNGPGNRHHRGRLRDATGRSRQAPPAHPHE